METRDQIAKILYWKDVIASPELLEKYATVIEKLRSGEYTAADLDLKIKSHPRVYSIKINDKERLLFTTITIDGVPYAYILEPLLNHKYESCYSMKPGAVEKILNSSETQKNIEEYFARQEKNKTDENKNSIIRPEKKYYQPQYVELDFLDHKWLQFNDEQRKVLYHPRPAICRGIAGAGKSLLALAIMAKALAEDINCHPIYITQSPSLRDEMKDNWEDSPYSKDLPEGAVRFATYEELLQESFPDKKLVSKDDCLKWIKQYGDIYRKLKPNDFSDTFFSPSDIYAEFRIISGYQNEEQKYFDLGVRQATVNSKEKKEWLLKAYKAYLAHLESRKCMHAAFTALPLDEKYHLVLPDEAQDFSLLQLSSLCQKAKDNNIFIFLDTDQSLHDKVSKLEYLKNLLQKLTKVAIKPLVLSLCYRSEFEVIQVGNHILELRIFLDGGRLSDDQEFKIMGLPEKTGKGSATWPEFYNLNENNQNDLKKQETTKKLLNELREHAKSSQCIVITLPEFKAEAEKIFGTGAVFTVEESKGLQFTEVIIYRLFDGVEDAKKLREANMLLAQCHGEISINTNLSKEREIKSTNFWKNLYTAVMRATKDVCIVQEKSHAIANIATLLMKKMTNKLNEKDIIENTGKESWEKTVITFIKAGNLVQAKNTYLSKIGSEQEYKILLEKFVPPEIETEKKAETSATKKSGSLNSSSSINPGAASAQVITNKENDFDFYPITINVDDYNDLQKSKTKLVLTYLNNFLERFSENNLDKLFAKRDVLKYLIGIKFSPRQSGYSIVLPPNTTESDINLQLLRCRPNMTATYTKSATEKRIDFVEKVTRLDSQTLLTHILYSNSKINGKSYAKIFHDYLCKKTNNVENIFRIAPKQLDKCLLILNNNNKSTKVTVRNLLIFGSPGLLHNAIFQGHIGFVQLLWQSGLIDSQTAILNQNILQCAAGIGATNIVKFLLGQKNFDKRTIDLAMHPHKYSTALHSAAANGHTEIVKLLVEAGANAQGYDESLMETPIVAAKKNFHEDIVKFLQSKGAKLPESLHFPKEAPKKDAMLSSLNKLLISAMNPTEQEAEQANRFAHSVLFGFENKGNAEKKTTEKKDDPDNANRPSG